jgi:hypothetical protein
MSRQLPLVVGALIGLAAALVGATRRDAALPAGAIASVDGRMLPAEEFEQAVEMLASDRREPPTERDRARVLDRLIDEELLVEYGLARGLVATDRAVRDVVVRAMLEVAAAERAGGPPSDEELRALYGGSGETPAFESARPALETAYAELDRSAAVRAYLAELRARADVAYAPDAAAGPR